MENLSPKEESNQFDNIDNTQLWIKVGTVADITDTEQYINNCKTLIPLMIKELKQVNSETRLLYGKPGDIQPWVLSDNKKVKIYRIIQRMANLQNEENPVRIKKQKETKTLDTYMGILKLKMCMSMVQVFAESYRRLVSSSEDCTRLKMDLNFISSTAVEINNDLDKALESCKTLKAFPV